jgi:dTDP-4-dehydrorhamnose 3,5-epimerase
MNITELELPGVKVIEPRVFEDFRGSYHESYSARTLKDYGIDTVFVQDNHSRTKRKGTLRGIHFQNNPVPQTKLVRCVRGRVWDVVVDLKRGSPTYRRWLATELSEDYDKQILIPNGYGHAFLTLTDGCEVLYKVDAFYEASLDRAIAWNDPEIGVDWPIVDPILSEKDIKAPALKDSDCNLELSQND